jgi:metallo-beta-lactamase family protein
MSFSISFFGAAKNVTGSCYLLTVDDTKIVIDCGMYQERKLKDRNWAPFGFDPKSVSAVILTHAHLDHCGRLPKLVHEGFSGNVFCTPATCDIAQIILADSAKIQEEDVAYKKRRHRKEGRKGPHPLVPLYTKEDAENVNHLFTKFGYGQPFKVADGIEATFNDAGHILGSATLSITIDGGDEKRTIIFSGDIGRWDTPLLNDPTSLKHADYVVTESTYGNRTHKDNSTIPETLERVINETYEAGGQIVIPSFAVERTQELLYHLHGLLAEKRIPRIPVFIDSPMAIRVTEVFQRHPELFDEDTLEMLRRGDHPCDFPMLKMSRTVDESKSINASKESCIVIAGSGMCTGGRIKHHLKANIGRPESTILFVGYQAVGTLGRRLLEGDTPVRIHGQEFDVKAKIAKVNGFSAHADRNELLEWLSSLEEAPRRVFVTHGEPDAAEAFGALIYKERGWNVTVPDYEDTIELD